MLFIYLSMYVHTCLVYRILTLLLFSFSLNLLLYLYEKPQTLLSAPCNPYHLASVELQSDPKYHHYRSGNPPAKTIRASGNLPQYW